MGLRWRDEGELRDYSEDEDGRKKCQRGRLMDLRWDEEQCRS